MRVRGRASVKWRRMRFSYIVKAEAIAICMSRYL